MRVAWADPRRSQGARWVIGVALLLLFVLVAWRETISQRLVPDPRMNRQLERAEAALRAGRLSAPDGSGARELYESVLATDPDQMVARQGLLAVREAALAQAQQALQARRIGQAKRQLALAEALSAPPVQMQPLRLRLQDLEESSGDIPALLARAAAPGVDDDGALALYNQVLQLDAGNEAAAQARRDLFSRWLAEAADAIAAGKLDVAQSRVSRVVHDDPAHLDLPPVQASLGEALARRAAEQARVLASAQADERAGRLDRAATKYLRLRGEGVTDPSINDGLQQLATRMAAQAQREAADFRFRRARASLDKARKWSADAPGIAAAERALAQSRQARQRLGQTASRGQRERVPALIAEASDAMERGDFLSPPGSSAWDKLRVASAIAGDTAALRSARAEFDRRTAACFEQAMTGNQLRRAQTCLEAHLAMEPGSAFATRARQRLAERWLAYAEERIGASDYPQAEQALAQARRWQPGHAMLDATQARLQRARGAAR